MVEDAARVGHRAVPRHLEQRVERKRPREQVPARGVEDGPGRVDRLQHELPAVPPEQSARSGGSVSLPLTAALSDALRPKTAARRPGVLGGGRLASVSGPGGGRRESRGRGRGRGRGGGVGVGVGCPRSPSRPGPVLGASPTLLETSEAGAGGPPGLPGAPGPGDDREAGDGLVAAVRASAAAAASAAARAVLASLPEAKLTNDAARRSSAANAFFPASFSGLFFFLFGGALLSSSPLRFLALASSSAAAPLAPFALAARLSRRWRRKPAPSSSSFPSSLPPALSFLRFLFLGARAPPRR